MVFSSVIFLYGFLPIFFCLYYMVPKNWKNHVCLLFSLGFYAWGEPLYILLMLASIGVNYLLGLGLGFGRSRGQRRLVMVLACCFNLGLLGVFKYSTFFGQAFLTGIGSAMVMPVIGLPLGISFYTFQILSYILDVYGKKAEVQKNPLHLALYVSMFPQLVAGPIVRYNDINAEISSRTLDLNMVSHGIFRFVVGLTKKVVIANALGSLTDGIWHSGGMEISTASAWLGIVAYTLQIYFDFGGYSDMAIGLGEMMGFHFMENFNYPYISKSVSEFWRRWHISLGSWFRDYVYFPMGGSRVSRGKLLRNTLVVWMITGLWHGANWTFIIWGLYYGILISGEKMLKLDKRNIWVPLRYVVTMFLVMAGWTMFRADSLSDWARYIGQLVGGGEVPLVNELAWLQFHDNIWLILVALVCATPLPKKAWDWVEGKLSLGAYSFLQGLVSTGFLGLCTVYLVNATYNPFIYFRF